MLRFPLSFEVAIYTQRVWGGVFGNGLGIPRRIGRRGGGSETEMEDAGRPYFSGFFFSFLGFLSVFLFFFSFFGFLIRVYVLFFGFSLLFYYFLICASTKIV